MKKLFLGLSLLVMSSSCFAIVNFTSSNGTLVMRDVVVDDTTVYDSVTLKLDLASGAFTILDATLKKDHFSSIALDSITENGLKVDFHGCALSGKNQITCMTKIVALDNNLAMNALGGATSNIYDNLSNQYNPSTVTALDKTNSLLVSFNLIQGIPVEVKFIYNNIKPTAESLSIFQPKFGFGCTIDGFSCTYVTGNFTDIAF